MMAKLSDFSNWRRWLAWSALYVAFAAAAYFLANHIPDKQFGSYLTAYILLVLVVSAYFLVPSRWLFISAPVIIGLLWLGLAEANRQKSDGTEFPLTATDLRMLVANPSGLLMSIGAPQWSYLVFELFPYAFAVVMILLVFRERHRFRPGQVLAGLVGFGIRALIVSLTLVMLNQSVLRSVRSYLTAHEQELGAWDAVGLVKFAERIGVLGFLSYSQYVEGAESNFLTYTPTTGPPPKEEIARSIDKYIDISKLTDGKLPNIIIIHAESTFDLNDVINLKAPVASDLFYTFQKDENRQGVDFRGPALVNIIGGGSWVTEFEVLHGIDSRLFGFAGHYTHASLSTNSRNALPRYLARRGYAMSAFTIDSAKFYNAEHAYKLYGFQNFYDQRTMGSENKDEKIMATALSIDDGNGAGPFLKFVILHENHAPHRCDDAYLQSYEDVEVLGNATKEHNCAVKEYVRRLRDEERAVNLAQDYLKSVEAKTGRPYLIAIYGDHQPFSFTGGGGTYYDMGLNFDEFRRDQTKRKVILEFISSKGNPFRCCWKEAVPITLFPDMVSAYVATSASDLYLPENFYQFDHCGSDWIGHLTGASFYLQSVRPAEICASYEAIVAAYKVSGVMGDPDQKVAVLAPAKIIAPDVPPQSPETTKSSCLPVDSDTRIVVSASGTRFGEPPKFDLKLDDKDLGTRAVETAPDNTEKEVSQDEIGRAETPFEFQAHIGRGAKEITVEFLNDRWAGENLSGDTNLWIRYVQVGDRVFTGSDLEPTSTNRLRGYSKGEWFVFPMTGSMKIDLSKAACS